MYEDEFKLETFYSNYLNEPVSSTNESKLKDKLVGPGYIVRILGIVYIADVSLRCWVPLWSLAGMKLIGNIVASSVPSTYERAAAPYLGIINYVASTVELMRSMSICVGIQRYEVELITNIKMKEKKKRLLTGKESREVKIVVHRTRINAYVL